MNHKTMIPELRFQEFDGEWKNRSMRDFTKINQGLQIPISERFYEKTDDNYFYITNEFLRKGSEKSYFIKNPSESVICYEDDILMTRTGNTGQVVTGVHGAFHNNFFKIKYDKTCSKWFLYYFLTSHKTQHTILKLAGTSTIPDLNHGDFYKITLNTPTFPEQQKIASFLSAVDLKIQQLSRKKELLEQYKKGVMQQLFSGKLRFKDENGNDYADWEEKKLGEVSTLLKDGSHGSHKDVPDGKHYLLSAKNIRDGRVNIDGDDRKISEDDFKSIYKNYTLEENDILLTIVGTIGRVAKYKGEANISFQRSVAFFRFKNISSDYVFQLMHGNEFQKELDTRKVVSAQPGIYLGDLAKIPLNIPCIDEQQKIADFLTSIDTKIESTNQQINQTQSFKKGLLQQMFV
jgi:type I restriction enzyme S subunit